MKSEDLCSPSPPFALIASSRGMKRPSLHLPAQVESLSPVLAQENLTFPLQPLRQQDVPDIPSPKPVTSAQQSVAVADPVVVLERMLPEPERLLGAEPSEARLSAKLEGMDLCSPSQFAPVLSSRGIQVWPSLHQQTLMDPSSTVVTQVEERVTASEKVSGVGEKDLLKELFPNEPGTPTGISATCRRPIRGAAGRPLPASDFWLNESRRRHSERIETSTYITETRTPVRAAALHLTSPSPFSSSSSSSSAGVPSTSPAHQRRSLPMWLQLLLLSVVAGFLFFVYQAMETNQASPFGGSKNLEGGGQ
ncbi:hypothetical protein GJAV_G00160680 [Gymnothorax javanicus]|nr:hypothetical protein GJAV_G00160680 [Gymnothorax javanicus]